MFALLSAFALSFAPDPLITETLSSTEPLANVELSVTQPNLPTVSNLDISAYMGRWYQVVAHNNPS
tara:strand:+ start:3129 stop:3326 length:198 start_codon:yes stop_codon:yes gene_type:complete